MTDAALIVFLGQFRLASFRDFIGHRADRLALQIKILTFRRDRVEIAVAGATELIDAFELACSLGPIDCLVLDHYRTPADEFGIGLMPQPRASEIWTSA
jgi:hypothetical protein